MTSGIFVGLSTIDLIHTIDEFPLPNTKAVASSQEILIGGPATNAAIAFSRLGGRALLVAPVGRHPLAALVKAELQSHAVSLIDLTPDSDLPSPVSSVWINAQGDRNIVSVNASRVNVSPVLVDRSRLRAADVLLVDGHAIEACHAWAEEARSAQVPVAFDGGSWKPGTEQLLRFVDTAICSANFMPQGCAGEDQAIEYLRAAGVSRIAITHGANPIQYFANGLSGTLEVPQVDAVDTSGAGDIFHGAFCFYIATDSGFVDSLRKAAVVAAESCRFHGTHKRMATR